MSGYLEVDVVNEGKYYFVGYNSEDMAKVSKYVKALAEKGLPMWYDYGIQVGDLWEETISEKIVGSEAVILFVSHNVFKKEKSFMHKEYRVSTRRKKKIFVVLLDDIKEEDIPPRYEMWWDDITGMQYIIAAQLSVDECVEKLIDEMGFIPSEMDENLESVSGVKTEDGEIIPVEKGKGIPLKLLKSKSSGGGEADKIAYEVEQVFKSRELNLHITEVKQGPAFFRYYLNAKPRASIRKIKECKFYIELAIQRSGVAIQVDAQSHTVTVDVPKKHRTLIYLADILESRRFEEAKPKELLFAVGEDIEGKAVVLDLCKLPHLLIGGCVSSGKSVQLHVTLLSLLMKHTPEQMKLLLIDPKKIEFSVYDKVPHLLEGGVIKNVREGIAALERLAEEMDRRYELLINADVRNIDDYNAKVPLQDQLPKIVAVVEEMSDFISTSKSKFENAVVRLLQKARASGIHLILSTQRPSPDVISGFVKANVPSRIAMRTVCAHDSRVLLDCSGAEDLIGNGDLLLLPVGSYLLIRCQGAYVTGEEIQRTVDYICEYYKD